MTLEATGPDHSEVAWGGFPEEIIDLLGKSWSLEESGVNQIQLFSRPSIEPQKGFSFFLPTTTTGKFYLFNHDLSVNIRLKEVRDVVLQRAGAINAIKFMSSSGTFSFRQLANASGIEVSLRPEDDDTEIIRQEFPLI